MFFFNNCHSCCCNRQPVCVKCRVENDCNCHAHNHCRDNRDCCKCNMNVNCCCVRQCDRCQRSACECRKCCCKCCNGIMPLGMNNGGDCGGRDDFGY